MPVLSCSRRNKQRAFVFIEFLAIFAVLLSLLFAAIGGNKDLDQHHGKKSVFPSWLGALNVLAVESWFILSTAFIFFFVQMFGRVIKTHERIHGDHDVTMDEALKANDLKIFKYAAILEKVDSSHYKFPCNTLNDLENRIVYSRNIRRAGDFLRWLTLIYGMIQGLYAMQQLHRIDVTFLGYSFRFPYEFAAPAAAVSSYITTSFRLKDAHTGIMSAIKLFQVLLWPARFTFLVLAAFYVFITFPFPYYYGEIYARNGLPNTICGEINPSYNATALNSTQSPFITEPWVQCSSDVRQDFSDVMFWIGFLSSYTSAAVAGFFGFLGFLLNFKETLKGMEERHSRFALWVGGTLSVVDAVGSGVWAMVLMFSFQQQRMADNLASQLFIFVWTLLYNVCLYFCYYGLMTAIPNIDKAYKAFKEKVMCHRQSVDETSSLLADERGYGGGSMLAAGTQDVQQNRLEQYFEYDAPPTISFWQAVTGCCRRADSRKSVVIPMTPLGLSGS